jgi:predicted transcriptional regulator
MPSQHRTTPLSIRLPGAERQRLQEYAARRELPVRRVILDAIREKLDREEAEDAA